MKEHWEYKKLGEIGDSELGKTKDSTRNKGSLQPYLCAINVLWDKFDLSNLKEMKFEDDEKERYSIKKGDLIICEGGDIGRAAIWSNERPILYQNALHRVRFKEGIEARFILFYLFYLKINGILDERYGKGVTIKHLVKTSLLSISVPVPPLSEQKRIVEELDLLSGIIEKQKQQLKELDTLAQSIFYEMFGDPVTNEKGWEVKLMQDVVFLKSGDSSSNNLPDGEIPYVKVADMNLEPNKNGIIESSRYVELPLGSKLLFPVGTTIFPKRGGAILTNKKRITKVQICCDLNIMGAIPKEEIINPLYLFYFFLFLDFSKLINGSSVPQINNVTINPLKIQIPPLHLQNLFAEKIEAIEKQKDAITKSIEETQKLFDYTMDKYFG